MKNNMLNEPHAVSGYSPLGSPAPGLATTPRVIFKTKRKNLSHEARIQRLSGQKNLLAWQEFSDAFVRAVPKLSADAAAYLHHKGFYPDKAVLYSLPNDQVDDYLSDIQVKLLHQVNDSYAELLYNKLIFWQAYRRYLPLVTPLCLISRRRLYPFIPNQEEFPEVLDQHEWLMVKPLEIHGSADKLINTKTRIIYHAKGLTTRYIALEQVLFNDPGEHLICMMPLSRASNHLNICRLFILRNPKNHLPFIASAVLLSTSQPLPMAGVMTGAMSARVNLETGCIDSVLSVIDGKISQEFDEAHRYLGQEVKEWWHIVITITSALRRLPVLNALQIDVLIGDSGFIITDVSGHIKAEDFQIHGPIMTSDEAKDFLREFGI